jgi:hypothetical protein
VKAVVLEALGSLPIDLAGREFLPTNDAFDIRRVRHLPIQDKEQLDDNE